MTVVAFALSVFPPSSNFETDNQRSLLFQADGPNTPQGMVLLNRERCTEVQLEGATYLEIERDTDPYSKVEWQFKFSKPWAEGQNSVVLEIEFYDHGAGVIEPVLLNDDDFAGQWSAPSRQSAYTRLNTNTLRKAAFEFKVSPIDWPHTKHPHLKIAGLQDLKSIRAFPAWSEDSWNASKKSIPVHVEPMVRLERPMEVVCTAGISHLSDPQSEEASLDNIQELAPLAKVLGFTSIEAYVRWDLLEPKPGEFDFSHYDSIVEEIRRHDLKWFPLLIVGSAYALPQWFKDSPENVGFVCLEHGLSDPIQSIWSPFHKKHVTRVLSAFGQHYEPMGVLEGVRLGPSGNFGESQYPAGGNWGYKGEKMHIHIGYWAGDEYAKKDFQEFLARKYHSIEGLNEAWQEEYPAFSVIQPILPEIYRSRRARLDMTDWYTRSMSDWCGWWAGEARKAMPHTKMYQSAGGWGFREAGTDFVAQAQSMRDVGGGIRLTNETDSFQQNVYVNRLAATAARLYNIPLGYEPASSHTARGTVGRLFNTVATNGEHFFTYHPNLFSHQLAIDSWLRDYHYFDTRLKPVVDVAVYYPETMNQLDQGSFRYLYAWGFFPRVSEIRRHIEVDHLDETLIREGYLDRYKALVFCWGNIIEEDVLTAIDKWVRKGGTVIYPSFPKGDLETVEGDPALFKKWTRGDTGEGSFHRFPGDMEPPSLYGDYVEKTLQEVPNLHPWTALALQVKHPDKVFFSIQEDGHLLALNYGDEPAKVELDGRFSEMVPSYAIARLPLE